MALNLDSTGIYPSLKRIKAVLRTPVGLLLMTKHATYFANSEVNSNR